MNPLEDKYHNNKGLSQDDINNYLEGKLSVSEQRRFEAEMLNNNLYADAVEGFSEFPDAANKTDNYKNQLKKKLSKKQTNWWQNNALLVAASFGLIIISGLSFYLFRTFNEESTRSVIVQNTTSNSTTTKSTNESEFIKPEEKVEEKIEPKQSPLMSANDKSQSVDNKTAKPISKSADSEPEALVESPMFFSDMDDHKSESTKKSALAKAAPAAPAFIKQKVSAPSSDMAVGNIPLRYIENVKVIDYALLRPEKTPTPSIEKQHTDAYLENSKSRTTSYDAEVEVKQITYNDFLEVAIRKFSKSKYNSALEDFKLILKQFPDDQNALFYGGLCFYEMKEYESSLSSLNKVTKNAIEVFQEEADWYKVLNLEKLGNIEICKALLGEIINQGGFYAEKAKKKLDKLNKY